MRKTFDKTLKINLIELIKRYLSFKLKTLFLQPFKKEISTNQQNYETDFIQI
jgi:hypothetical protein